MDWKGQKILIMGAARQGTALAAYFAAKGAFVTLSDLRSAENFAQAQRELPSSVQWAFGEPPLSLLDGIQLLCLSGGVSPEVPLAQEARRRSIAISNDSQLFLEAAPCPVIGITGSAGKTTTTILTARMLNAEFLSRSGSVWIGGNIGNPLISNLDQMSVNDLAVMELSSFQLELMDRSPQIAALLNLAPNHLDRHANMADYAAAKAHIFDFQNSTDIAILNREDSGSWAMRDRIHGELRSFGLSKPSEGTLGSFLADKHICLRDKQGERRILPVEAIELRGEHNLFNAAAATLIASLAGASDEAIRMGVEDFKGAPHRLEWVRSLNGVDWYNDSIATSPQRAEASIHSFVRPIILLAGGRDKGLDWQSFAQTANERAKEIVAFGEAANLISELFQSMDLKDAKLTRAESLKSAIQAAEKSAIHGDVVLLAPGGTSFDEFADFEERGLKFREWVDQL